MRCRKRIFWWGHGGLSLVLGALVSSAAVPLQIGLNFTGSQSGIDSDAQPVDANGAAGPNHFVELINGRFAVYAKASGVRVKSLVDVTFWTSAGVVLGNSLDITDPRVVFDPDSQRWFASCIDTSSTLEWTSRNRFLIAVSASADPTDVWHGFAFVGDPVNGDFVDFPTLGMDQANVYLGASLYTPALGLHIGSTLVALPKADLLANVPSIQNRTSFGMLPFNLYGRVPQPAVGIGTSAAGQSVLAVGSAGLGAQAGTKLFVTTVQNGTALHSVSITVPPFSLPAKLAQPDGSTTIDAGDARLSATVRRVGEVLYAAHCIGNGAHAAVRWYRINSVDQTLLQSGTIADPNLDLSYPSIAANQAGTVVVACNGSGTNSYVSCYAVAGQTVNGTLEFGELVLLKAGQASYQAPQDNGISRWGDYSALSVDPVDSTRFWSIQAYPTDVEGWATQITELVTGAQLHIVTAGANVEISWPATLATAQLESATSLAPTGQWTAVQQVPSVSAGQARVVLPASDRQSYFRLVQ